MSTRDDSRLTPHERAVFADIEASAAAADPQFASRLRGPGRWKLVARMPSMPGWIGSLWVAVPAVIIGLTLTIVSLSTSLAVGVTGAVVAVAGFQSLASIGQRRWGGGG